MAPWKAQITVRWSSTVAEVIFPSMPVIADTLQLTLISDSTEGHWSMSGTQVYEGLVYPGREAYVKAGWFERRQINPGDEKGYFSVEASWGPQISVALREIPNWFWSKKISLGIVPEGPPAPEVPPITPPTPPPPEGPPPPPITGPTLPPTPENWWDIAAWLKWLGLVFAALFEWLVVNIWNGLLAVLQAAADYVFKAIPTWFTDTFSALTEGLKSWSELLKNPGLWLSAIVDAWYKEKSPSIADDFMTGFANVIESKTTPEWIVGTPFYNALSSVFVEPGTRTGKEVGALIDSIPAPGSEEALASTIFVKLSGLVNDLSLSSILIEALSLGQVEAQGRLVDNTLAVGGFIDIAKDMWIKRYQSNLGRRLQHIYNAKYLAGIPPFNELTTMRRLELLEAEEYRDLVAASDGIDSRMADLLYRASLAPPNLDDYIRFNLRHPEKAKTLEEIQAIVNIDAIRFGEIFQERLYLDPSITEARYMYEGGAIDDKFVFDIVRRNRFRTEPLPGQTKSDAQALTDFLIGFQTRIWRRQKLLALRAGFIAGIKDEGALQEEASKLLTNPEAITLYVDTCKLRKELAEAEPKEPKVFPWSIVKALRAAMIWDEARAREEFEAEGYDEEHVDALVELSAPAEETTPA